MQRLPDWQRRLANTISTAHHVPFAWGTWDCALAACRLIHAVTGVDPAESYRGKYADEAGAIAILGASDLGTFAASVAASYGMEEVPPLLARRGDLVLVNNAPPPRATAENSAPVPTSALGIVGLDPRFAHCAAEHGMKRIALHRWLRAWRVG
jgi:hypothetical protein